MILRFSLADVELRSRFLVFIGMVRGADSPFAFSLPVSGLLRPLLVAEPRVALRVLVLMPDIDTSIVDLRV